MKIPLPKSTRNGNVGILYIDYSLSDKFTGTITLQPYSGRKISFNEMTIFFRAFIPPKLENKTGWYYLISKTEGHPRDTFIVFARYEQGHLTCLGFETGNGTVYRSWVLPAKKIPNIQSVHDYVITISREGPRLNVSWFIDGNLISSSLKGLSGSIYISKTPAYIFKDPIPHAKLQIMIIYDRALNANEVKNLSMGYLYPRRANVLYMYLSTTLKHRIILDWLIISGVYPKIVNFANINELCNITTLLILLHKQSYIDNLLKILKTCSSLKNIILLVIDNNSTELLKQDKNKKDTYNIHLLNVNRLIREFILANKSTRINFISNFTSCMTRILPRMRKIALESTSSHTLIPFFRYYLLFKKGIVKGNLLVSMNSGIIVFPQGATIKIINSSKNYLNITITNITKIWISSNDQVIFNSTETIICGSSDGIHVSINGINFILLGKVLHLLVQLRENSYIEFSNVTVLIRAPKYVVLTPKLKVQAQKSLAFFYEATTVGKLSFIIKTRSWLNEGLNVKGDILMDISYGGTFLVVKHFYYKGFIERYRGALLYPKYEYNEYRGLMFAILVFLYFLLNQKAKRKSKELISGI